MAGAYTGPVSAVQVGSYFVGQYYQVLQRQPNLVYQFYTDASSMTRIDGAATETANGMLQIHTLIMSLSFIGIEIKTAHSLESWNGGVLVLVSGSVQIKEFNGRRKFVQTFFLAPQEKGYFVLSDIFQLQEEELQHHPAAILAHNNFDSKLDVSNPLPEPAVSDYILGGEIQADDFVGPVHAEESEIADHYSMPETQQQVSEADSMVEEETPAEEPVASFTSAADNMALFMSATDSIQEQPAPVSPAPVEEPVGEPPKHTYASILRIAKGQSGHSVPQPSIAKSVPVASDWQNVSQPSTQQSFSLPSAVPEKSNIELEEVVTLEDEGEVTSVYVRNLPSSASASDLEQEFKNFGRIKPEGVLIKSRRDVGIYYAFVEFEDISGVQNAVKASPILFCGRQIHVEERRPNGNAFRGGRRGRGGRGGYQSDAPRGGRFGIIRTFGRGSGQDNSDRGDYNSRPRGNGFHPRGPRQERGILGNQAFRNEQNPSD